MFDFFQLRFWMGAKHNYFSQFSSEKQLYFTPIWNNLDDVTSLHLTLVFLKYFYFHVWTLLHLTLVFFKYFYFHVWTLLYNATILANKKVSYLPENMSSMVPLPPIRIQAKNSWGYFALIQCSSLKKARKTTIKLPFVCRRTGHWPTE